MPAVSSLGRREKPAATPVRSNGESGQVLILAVLAITVVFVIGVITVDVGMWLNGRASVVNAVDQATMAGSMFLPKDGAMAEAVARQYAEENEPDIQGFEATFRCIVGDRNGDGQPDSGDIPAVCPQLTAAAFTCIDGLCYANCSFSAPKAKCNTIVVKGSKDVPFAFGPIFGLGSGAAAGFTSAACRGACGGPPTAPLDVVEAADRTNSMCPNNDPDRCAEPTSDLSNAKNGARSVLELYNPEVQRVALATLPPSIPTDDCESVASNSDPGNWVLTPLLGDYKNPDDSLNTSSEIVSDIGCLRPPSWVAAQTDLGSPMKAAKELLIATGRPDVKWGIIFLTDGAANQPTYDTGLRSPSADAAVTTNSGDNNGFQTNPTGAYADDSARAEDPNSGTNTNTSCGNTGKDRHDFFNYGISVPSGNAVVGIEVRLHAWISSTTSTTTRRMCVQLSWDGGTSWTTAQQTSNFTTSQQPYTLGDSGDTWGHAWTPSELSNANFRVRVTDVASNVSRTFYLDWVAVRVYHLQDNGPCDYAAKQAAAAKALDPPIEVFTIGFGVADQRCTADAPSSPYHDVRVTQLLADMATDSEDDGGDGPGGLSGGCDTSAKIASENADGDHFLCEAKGADLEPIFRAAAEALASGSRLVSLPF